MLFNHMTGDGWLMSDPNYKGPIGRWENPRVENGQLLADPIFDLNDSTGKILADKVENGFIRAASIGFRILSTSNDPKDMIAGQTRPTVTSCELMEISVVDLPANKNALCLFDADGARIDLKDESITACLSAVLTNTQKPSIMKLKIMAAWTGLMAVFGKTATADQESIEIDTTPEALSALNDKLVASAALTAENATLKADNETLTTSLSAANAELASAKAEIVVLKTPAAPSVPVVNGEEIPEAQGTEKLGYTETSFDLEKKRLKAAGAI